MQTDAMILLKEFCVHHNIELNFVYALKESGLISLTGNEDQLCITESQLPHLEKLVRLYYEMDINLEGIETITYLLGRMQEMHQQIMLLNNRLSIYEQD